MQRFRKYMDYPPFMRSIDIQCEVFVGVLEHEDLFFVQTCWLRSIIDVFFNHKATFDL